MEPERRGEEEELAGGPGGGGGGVNDADAVACLCPAAIDGAARGPLFPPRHALEQEMLRRAELQLHVGGGDRRRERKMKNRESAARSRARRHAYVSELEKEVRLLQAENDELRRLCHELSNKEAAQVVAPVTSRAPQPQPPLLLLRRTSSAPL